MKKILATLGMMVFALALNASAMELGNGITVTGVSADEERIIALSADPAADMYVEGYSAGGLRPDREVWNGITVFERAELAGKPEPELKVSNGITDFKGMDELF